MVVGKVTVNGRGTSIADVPLHITALDFLRECGLTGCKEGCAEGECGACSVMVARPGLTTPTEWVAVNACLVPIASFDGQEIVTAEGLGALGELHPVQQEMAVRGGSQCGYCTPGFICSMAAEYYRPDRRPSSERDAEPDHGPNGFDLHALSGNLCRCTGYRPIRDAAYALGAPPPDDSLAARLSAPPTEPAATRPPPSSPVRPTGVSRSTSAVGGPRRSSRSTVSPSFAAWSSGPTRSRSGPR